MLNYWGVYLPLVSICVLLSIYRSAIALDLAVKFIQGINAQLTGGLSAS